MGVEWVAVGAVLAAGALFVGFPFGVAVGYGWRDRISRGRRIRYLVARERRRAEPDGAATALARPDTRPAGRSDGLRVGKPAEEVAAASPGLSARAIAEETGIHDATISRALKKATGSNDSVAKRTGKDGKRRKMPTESELKVVRGDVLQEPGPDRMQLTPLNRTLG
jgi:hypothetical protein